MESTEDGMFNIVTAHSAVSDAYSTSPALTNWFTDGSNEQPLNTHLSTFTESTQNSPASYISLPAIYETLDTTNYCSPMSDYQSSSDLANYYSNIGSELSSPMSSHMSVDNNAAQSPQSAFDAPSPSFYGFNSGTTISQSDFESVIEDIQELSDNIYQRYESFEIRTEPYLSIVLQPAQRARFRYESEMQGKHGSIMGIIDRYDDDDSKKDLTQKIREKLREKICKNKRTGRQKEYPTVQLHNFDGEARIRCSLYQVGRPFKHYHTFYYPDRSEVTVSNKHKHKYFAVFDGLSITHTAKRSIDAIMMQKQELAFQRKKGRKPSPGDKQKLLTEAKKEAALVDLNKVCLRFDAEQFVDGKWISIGQPIYSKPIYSTKSALTGELKICRSSLNTGKAEGGDDIFLLVEKVGKKSIEVLFVEPDAQGNIIWKAQGEFKEIDVHHQYAIALKTPQYHTTDINNEARVYMLLHRKDDHAISDLYDFNYISSIDTLTLSLYQDLQRQQQFDTIRTDSAANEFISSVDDVTLAKTNPKLYFHNVLKEYATLIASTNDDGKYPGLIEFLDKCKRQKILQRMNFLHIACTIARPKLVEFLLQNGVDANRKNADGETPLHLAVRKENIKCIAALLNVNSKIDGIKHIRLDEYNANGLTAFHLAVSRNNLSICKILEAKGNQDKNSVHDQIDMYGGNTALHIAADHGSVDVLKYLLERGQIDVKSANLSGHTALCMAFDDKVIDLLKMYGAVDDHEHDDEEIEEFSERDDSEAESVDGDHKTTRITSIETEIVEISRSAQSVPTEECESDLEVNGRFSAINLNSRKSKVVNKADIIGRTEQPFDILSLIKLSKILNQNDKWKMVANELDFHDYIQNWQDKSDPTKYLIKFAEATRNSKIKLREIFSKMNETDAAEIVNAKIQ